VDFNPADTEKHGCLVSVSLYALNVRGLTQLVRGETDEAGVSV